MNRSSYLRAARLCGVLVVIVLLSILCIRQITNMYFQNSLDEAGSKQTVEVRGNTYTVVKGVVEGTVSSVTLFRDTPLALRLAYAQEIARRSPLFDISGTDPETLRLRINDLASSTDSMAALQKDAASATIIRDTMFPLRFLRALADAAEAREAFLRQASKSTRQSYRLALDYAMRAGESDAALFQKSYADALESIWNTDISTFGGTMTPERSFLNLTAILNRFGETSEEMERREQCIRGWILSCNNADLALPDIAPEGTADTHDPVSLEIRDLMAKTFSPEFFRTHQEVSLQRSACVSMRDGPYRFYIRKLEYSGGFPPTEFINERFFADISNAPGLIPSYLRDVRGITYLYVNPMTFYSCQDVGRDFGIMRAILEAAEFARAHPDIAPALSSELLSGNVLFEETARIYIASAAETLPPTANEYSRIIEILLMFENKSAGLDYIVGEVAGLLNIDRKAQENGVPFDNNPKSLFATHTAFPTMFLSHNPSAGVSTIEIKRPNELNYIKLLDRYREFSSLRHTVPMSIFEHDTHEFDEFERLSY